ncbi:phosphoenolpyruvate carboxykinase (ATP) [Mariprofundus sp. NF]|uniref:phosphoenolpyruvate carboxykinase (ATP) n=1 Tax=Mariprofundus sp. NF TaxID=2608716 RepID=UPI0015A1A280|nr:phosphoenolpyruvate carboxykinase (ATP) [Mariprofundus sp. NF]NWF37530.1 phosphoenolpyruvate carboxykinase (ATP) [Mariprofundus sp. NF]
MPYNKKQISEELAISHLGLKNLEDVYWNLPTPRLYEHAIRNHEGHVAHRGALVVRTGHFTGRAVKDKFIVDEPSSRDKVWWGDYTSAFSEERFDALYKRVQRYLEGQQVYVEDALVGADSGFEKQIRVITQDAWHSLFARIMYVRPGDLGRDVAYKEPEFTVIHVPHFHAMPSRDGTNSEAFVILHLGRRIALIGGTSYAGEIKTSIFTIMNYLLPDEDVLPLHASANVGEGGDVAIFLGLDGTGKTTLSSDPSRRLIGDDEHGWSQNHVFNFEGGCYARIGNLSAEKEPMVYEATQRFGTLIENVGLDTHSRRLDFEDTSLTENIRAAYPIEAIPDAIWPGVAAQPSNMVLLSADAFGVLPAIAKLSPEQAMYYFLLGYSTNIPGIEEDVKEPEATFSPCFGAPFLAQNPSVYANMLGEKIRSGNVQCWLLNTGWSGGDCTNGARMDIELTRTLLSAALSGALSDIKYQRHPIFGLQMPETLDPITTWSDPKHYMENAEKLAISIKEAMAQFKGQVPDEVFAAGPR